LQIGGDVASATVLHRHHVVHDTRWCKPAALAAHPTQGVLTQEGCAHQPPLAGLVEANLAIKATPCASVFAVDERPMDRAVARLCKHRWTPRVSTWCRGAAGHRKSLQKDAAHPQIRLGFLREQSVHTNTINNPKEAPMTYRTTEFTVDELGFIQIAQTKVLVAAARGELDLNRLAREEMASRGLDLQGEWVGFDRARQIHQVEATK
jgi:hypothetical protein